MGHRTVERVALDFKWPLHKVWEGYINPDDATISCAACGGEGYAPDAKSVADQFYNFEDRELAWRDKITQDEVQALVDEERLHEWTHTWSREAGWVRREDGYVPTAAEVNAAQHPPYKSFSLGHDAINRQILIEARCKRLGIVPDCSVCGGMGEVPNPDVAARGRAESWQKTEPPAGPGWQLWETTSEGSPISPVCASAEALATWCAEGASIFGKEHMPREEWLALFQQQDPAAAVDVGSMLVVEVPR